MKFIFTFIFKTLYVRIGPELGTGGESDSINSIKTALCSKIAKANKDIIIGLKVRLDKNITDGGRIEHEVFKKALEIADDTKLPLMVHHTNSGIPLGDSIDAVQDAPNPSNLFVPGSLRKGDIYTHTYSINAGSLCTIYDTEMQKVRKSIERYFKYSIFLAIGRSKIIF